MHFPTNIDLLIKSNKFKLKKSWFIYYKPKNNKPGAKYWEVEILQTTILGSIDNHFKNIILITSF